jgi:hypothetical protein
VLRIAGIERGTIGLTTGLTTMSMNDNTKDKKQADYVKKQVTTQNPAGELAKLDGIDPEALTRASDHEGEILARRIQISKLYYRDQLSYMEIGQEMGLNWLTVRNIVFSIRDEAVSTTVELATNFIEDSYEQLEILKAKYNRAWRRSLEIMDREEFSEKGTPAGKAGPDGKKNIITTESTRHRYKEELNTKPLEGMLKCIMSQAKLLGIGEKKSPEEIAGAQIADNALSYIQGMNPEQKANAFAGFILSLANEAKLKGVEPPNAAEAAIQFSNYAKDRVPGENYAMPHQPVQYEAKAVPTPQPETPKVQFEITDEMKAKMPPPPEMSKVPKKSPLVGQEPPKKAQPSQSAPTPFQIAPGVVLPPPPAGPQK